MTSLKLAYKTLVEQLTDALLTRIDTEGLKPGDKLPSAAVLGQDYGVSRSVVREALKILEGRGVIEIAGGKSAVIRPLNDEIFRLFFHSAMTYESGSVKEILEVRYGIEVQGARLAAQRRTTEQLTALRMLVDRMAKAVEAPETYADLDVEFHLLVAQATQNTLLSYLVSGIRDALHGVIREGLKYRLTAADRLLVQSTHEAIVEQIAAGDPDGAAAAMIYHFDDALRTIIE